MNRLDLVVGSDGAGKSTFVELTLAPSLPGSAFVNADEIAKRRWPDDPALHSSELELIDIAGAAGYTVILHAILIPARLAVLRVRHRVEAGGHDVAEQKIRERYQRLWNLVGEAAMRADSATFYDNSTIKGPRIVARMAGGFIVGAPIWPTWTPTELTNRWPR